MQFKDLFHKKNIIRLLVSAFILFLLLPIIFPEETNVKPISKEKSYFHEDSPLPIFPKDNPIQEYAKRFKQFYKIRVDKTAPPPTPKEVIEQLQEEEKEQIKEEIKETERTKDIKNINNKEDKNISITPRDLFVFDDNEDDTIYANNSTIKNDNTVNLQKGTVITNDGLILHPIQEGYYYKNKFYKNGTYPKNAYKKHIEGALNRYHTRVANKLGKKAVYFADEKGNLTVSYIAEIPKESSTDIDTYIANKYAYNNNKNKQNKFTKKDSQKNYYKYQNDNTDNLKNENIDYEDIAIASIRNIHAAYNLIQNKINSGAITQGVDINKPFENAIVNNFLNNNNLHSNEITSNNPAEPQTPPANPEESDTVIAGDQNFAQNYADKIHELNCGTNSRESTQAQTELEQDLSVPAAIGIMKIGNNNFSCDTAPLIVEQSASITNTVSQESDFEKFANELNEITTQSDKTDINIISTDRNFYPVASKLNNEESIKNNSDLPVTVHIIGPNEEEADLSKVLKNVTYSITDDTSVADKLTDDLTNYYALTQEENTDTHTILAFPTEDENKVFILTDPNNSYWLKNPSQLESLPTQYMERNGVYYKGVIVNKTQIGDLVQEERTNLLYISDKDYTHALQNGSVLTTVKEEDIKINSLHPQQIQQNTEMIKSLTEKGQQQLKKQESEQQQKKQPIEIIDIEKGNKIIQPKS